jgi:hypothetical protein
MNVSLPSIEQFLEFIQHWPDATILAGCSVFAWLLTLALEWWFLPIAIDPAVKRRQQGLTFVFCWAVSALSSSILWWALDPADPLKVRVSVSVVVGAFGFFAYPPIARLVSEKVPAIGSAWDGIRGGK